MSTQRDDQFKSIGKSVFQILKNNTNIKISKAAIGGSYARQQQHSNSDLDMIFAVPGDPNKSVVYPTVLQALKASFPNYNPKYGTSKNVLKIDVPNLGHVDIKLKTSAGFDHELNSNKRYRSLNL